MHQNNIDSKGGDVPSGIFLYKKFVTITFKILIYNLRVHLWSSWWCFTPPNGEPQLPIGFHKSHCEAAWAVGASHWSTLIGIWCGNFLLRVLPIRMISVILVGWGGCLGDLALFFSILLLNIYPWFCWSTIGTHEKIFIRNTQMVLIYGEQGAKWISWICL